MAVTKATFEDALAQAKFGRFQYLLIFLSGFLMSSIFFEIMGMNFTLPVAECDLNITSKSQYGIISGSFFLGIIVSSHFWGLLSDVHGRKKIITIAPILAFLTTLLSSISVNFWMLTVFRFFNGVCMAGAATTIFAYLGEFLILSNRSRSIMIASTIFSIFTIIVPINAYFVIGGEWRFEIPILNITYKPWRLFVIISGLPSLICGIALMFFPESPKYTFAQGNTKQTIEIFQKIHHWNCGNKDSNYNIKEILSNDEFPSASTKHQGGIFRMMIHNTIQLLKNYPRPFWLISFLQFGIFYIGHGMLLFFPDILNQISNTDENLQLCEVVEHAIHMKSEQIERICVDHLDSTAYLNVLILQALNLAGYILISIFVNIVGRPSIFVFFFLTTSICGILIIFIKSTLIATYLYMWLLLCGVCSNLLNTVTYEKFPTNLRSMAMSTTLLFGRIGALAGSNVAGILLERSCDGMFIIAAIFLFTCALISFFVTSKSSQVEN